jgi:hypothetical protein
MGETKHRQSTAPDAMKTPPSASAVEMLVTWVGLVAGAMAIILLATIWLPRQFGLQIVSLVGDTELVFFLVFCDSRAWRGYSLRNKRVQQELPHLLDVHCLFLILVFALLTFALSARSRLPSSWLVESGPKYDSPFALGLIVIGTMTAMTQAWIYRKILRRAVAVENATTR